MGDLTIGVTGSSQAQHFEFALAERFAEVYQKEVNVLQFID